MLHGVSRLFCLFVLWDKFGNVHMRVTLLERFPVFMKRRNISVMIFSII
jgi:hypothetical protein